MEKLILSGFMTEQQIIEATRKLLSSNNEIECRNILRELSIGQLKKLKAFISCQEKELSNSFTLLSMLIAASAILLTISDKFDLSFIIWILYGIPVSLSLGMIYFIYKDGVGLINTNNLHNKKIKYILFLIDSEIDAKQ
ncbi:hypothetical protein [Mesobacillus jeotgali]|uniref:hypothetical protein n=1 Tax=Mesobacillus jeotgali TaxID=129985 RepID=UPI001CFC555E|nr:hypothetical protein [Mesobacillus jeotgali]